MAAIIHSPWKELALCLHTPCHVGSQLSFTAALRYVVYHTGLTPPSSNIGQSLAIVTSAHPSAFTTYCLFSLSLTGHIYQQKVHVKANPHPVSVSLKMAATMRGSSFFKTINNPAIRLPSTKNHLNTIYKRQFHASKANMTIKT